MRVGVESGEVLVADVARGSTFASGPAVNMAARLQGVARPGEALIGPACHRLVRDRVAVDDRPGLSLKGIGAPVHAARLLAVEDVTVPRAVGSVPLVGRTRELDLLRQAFRRATVDRTCQLATVLGGAGMGKSRVTSEFVADLGDSASVLRGRCLPYGEGVTYWPLVEAVRQAAGLSGAEPQERALASVRALLGGAPDAHEVVSKLSSAAGLGGTPASQEDTAWAVRRLLTEMARSRPVVLVVEDLHWAEPGLIALLDDVCSWLRNAAVLVFVNARLEFLDASPGWGAGRANGVTASLEPLADSEIGTMAEQVLGGPMADRVLSRLLELAGGNPLYVEQLLAMLVDDGLLRRSGVTWEFSGGSAGLDVPESISALIAARLDRLPGDERAVLGVAAVIGQVFYREAVAELAGVDSVGRSLTALARKRLVQPCESDMAGQEAIRFCHVLVRDSAYATLPKTVRADLHKRCARWLERAGGGEAYDGFVGGHLEAAYLARADLGEPDAQTVALGAEAAGRLASAARSIAFADDDGARALLERADRLLVEEDPLRWQIRLDLALLSVNDGTRLAESRRLAGSVLDAVRSMHGAPRWATMARIIIAHTRQETDPEGATEILRDVAERALHDFPVDEEICLVAREALSDVAAMRGDSSASVAEMRAAAGHARRAGRAIRAEMLELGGTFLMVDGSVPLDECMVAALRRWRESTARIDQAVGAAHAGAVAAMIGDSAVESEAFAFAAGLADELKSTFPFFLLISRFYADAALGRWSSAARAAEASMIQLSRQGHTSRVSTQAALLALLRLHLGDIAAARTALALALQSTSSDDVVTLALSAAAQAWLDAEAGDAEVARSAIERACACPDQLLLDRALIHLSCAEVEELLDDPSAAAAHRRRALDLYRMKGATAAAARLENLAAHQHQMGSMGRSLPPE